LNLATVSGINTENRIIFSLTPYLTPNETSETKASKKWFKRVRKPVKYAVEPLPDKIAVEFVTDRNTDQAFIGDSYNLKV